MYREPRGARKVNPQNDGRRHSVGVKAKEWKGAWWVFVDHQGRRKAKRAGPGSRGKKLAEADRKSTRLNSSHGYISYAVFCLEKNNTMTRSPSNPSCTPRNPTR